MKSTEAAEAETDSRQDSPIPTPLPSRHPPGCRTLSPSAQKAISLATFMLHSQDKTKKPSVMYCPKFLPWLSSYIGHSDISPPGGGRGQFSYRAVGTYVREKGFCLGGASDNGEGDCARFPPGRLHATSFVTWCDATIYDKSIRIISPQQQQQQHQSLSN